MDVDKLIAHLLYEKYIRYSAINRFWYGDNIKVEMEYLERNQLENS